ncbi:VOC family protein [Mycobacterium sp. IDR2000157661]|uniref:VOC family protein n=1 Tax=Mycobacterium sp. IDR2000157661 TaxID=2867005 RepID=UPI001EEC25F8|nr:VOC family protein [Mycobacterium sp. IDR2000157661]ULE31884.1 hypothetical protein K3G64_17085 [Mycobacterium sp. IDR2000157661]
MTLRLGPLVVEAADPPAVAAFWAAVLGADAQRRLQVVGQERPKTVKNRVHFDLGGPADPQGNEVSVLSRAHPTG